MEGAWLVPLKGLIALKIPRRNSVQSRRLPFTTIQPIEGTRNGNCSRT